MKPTLVILAAGMGSRYGGLKQLDPVGPSGETILDYSIYDAIRAGFGKVVFVIRHEMEAAFRESVGSKYADKIPVTYAFQSLDDLPSGFSVPPERAKPWGTAHAIRAARAAINADDFYGRDAFAQLGAFLSQPQPSCHFAMVGYLLKQTLSDNGSVARGICELDDRHCLRHVRELTKLVRTPEGAENQGADGVEKFTGEERVSMNLWGFGTELFDALEARFPDFLRQHANEPKAEWYIPFVVDELIQEGKATVAVLPTASSWFGVTYREDKPFVVASINRLVEAGEYPARLWAAADAAGGGNEK